MWSLKMDKASKLTEWIVIAVLKDGRGLEKGIKETHWKSVPILHINYTSKNVQLKNLWLCTKSMEIWRFDKMTNTESMSTIKITSIFFMSQLYTGSAKKFMWVFFFFCDIIQKNMNELFGQPNTYTLSIWPGKFRKATYRLGQPAIWANQEQALFWDAEFNCIMLEFLQFDPDIKVLALISPFHSFQLAGCRFLN